MQKSHYFKKCSDSEVRVKHFKRLIFTYFTVIVFFQVGKGDSSTEAIWSLRQGTGERLLRVGIHGRTVGGAPALSSPRRSPQQANSTYTSLNGLGGPDTMFECKRCTWCGSYTDSTEPQHENERHR